jgi:hypothetical protein
LDGVRGVEGGRAADLGASGVVVAGLGVSNVFGVSKEVGRWIWVGLGVLTGFGASKVGGRLVVTTLMIKTRQVPAGRRV